MKVQILPFSGQILQIQMAIMSISSEEKDKLLKSMGQHTLQKSFTDTALLSLVRRLRIDPISLFQQIKYFPLDKFSSQNLKIQIMLFSPSIFRNLDSTFSTAGGRIIVSMVA